MKAPIRFISILDNFKLILSLKPLDKESSKVREHKHVASDITPKHITNLLCSLIDLENICLNDILRRVIDRGLYKPLKVEQTISPSMDIQIASNFERLLFDICLEDSKKTSQLMKDINEKGEFKLKEEQLVLLRENFLSESLNDDETKLIIKEIYKQYKQSYTLHNFSDSERIVYFLMSKG